MADDNNIENHSNDVDDNENRTRDCSDENPISDIPTLLIVTNVADDVFDKDDVKDYFESVFREYDSDATFHYLKSFRRALVNYTSSTAATKTRIRFHEADICNKTVKCYFAQPKRDEDEISAPHLELPAPYRQYLISPPCSPPVGWDACLEATPFINYDLITAIAQLAPGETHELHPQTENQPGIMVHICEDDHPSQSQNRPKIQQTRCPERKT